MMLIMVFGGLMMLAMPYVMVGHLSFFFPSFRRADAVYNSSWQKNMDPELLQEAQQNQARLRGAYQSGDMKSRCVSRQAILYMIPDGLRNHA